LRKNHKQHQRKYRIHLLWFKSQKRFKRSNLQRMLMTIKLKEARNFQKREVISMKEETTPTMGHTTKMKTNMWRQLFHPHISLQWSTLLTE